MIRSVLAVVPARGGSKGVPLKNLRRIGGRSLVQITAETVAQIPEIELAVVSTDHEEIAAEAERFGLRAPFRRPESLSGDRISDIQVLQHALAEMEKLEKKRYDAVVMLQPTCPLRKPEHVRECLRLLEEKNAPSAWTVSPVDVKFHPLKQLSLSESGDLNYFLPEGKSIIARQQLTETYIRNGACYAWRREWIEKGELLPPHTLPVIIRDRLVNIDTLADLAAAEALLPK